MVPEGIAWERFPPRKGTSRRGSLHPTSFPSCFQQHRDPNDRAANHPLSLPTLLIAA